MKTRTTIEEIRDIQTRMIKLEMLKDYNGRVAFNDLSMAIAHLQLVE